LKSFTWPRRWSTSRRGGRRRRTIPWHLRAYRADEQLPLVARIVNAIGLSLSAAHFWGMDEWVLNAKEVSATHPLSFEKADREMCFDRIDKKLAMPDENLHFRRPTRARIARRGTPGFAAR